MVTHRGNLNYQDCRRVLIDGYVEDGPNFLDDKVGRCDARNVICGWLMSMLLCLVEVYMLSAWLMCSSCAVVTVSRSMDWNVLGLKSIGSTGGSFTSSYTIHG